MPSYAVTKALIDTLFAANWGIKPAERWGFVELFTQASLPAANYDIAVGANAASDIQVAARTAVQIASAFNPFFALTGRNAVNQPAEACIGDAGGGIKLATISTGVAANDSSCLRPMSNFSLFASGPAVNYVFNTDKSPEFGIVVAHLTSYVASNNAAFQFQAGLRTASGFDPTQANYSESNNCGDDGAFFASSSTGTIQCVTRNNGTSTTVDTGISMLDASTMLEIKIDANRVPTFLINGTAVQSGAALRSNKDLIPTASIKTTAVAQKIVKLRAMRATHLLTT